MFRPYGNWRSLAAYRVRVGLHLNGFAFEQVSIDLGADEQLAPTYRLINPQAALPTLLVDDGTPLTQSLAILEYLEERRREPSLLPDEPQTRAEVRSLALLVAADHHHLVTPRVTRYLADICLASQILGARAFGVDVGAFPRVAAIGEACFAVEAFARTPFVNPTLRSDLDPIQELK